MGTPIACLFKVLSKLPITSRMASKTLHDTILMLHLPFCQPPSNSLFFNNKSTYNEYIIIFHHSMPLTCHFYFQKKTFPPDHLKSTYSCSKIQVKCYLIRKVFLDFPQLSMNEEFHILDVRELITA